MLEGLKNKFGSRKKPDQGNSGGLTHIGFVTNGQLEQIRSQLPPGTREAIGTVMRGVDGNLYLTDIRPANSQSASQES